MDRILEMTAFVAVAEAQGFSAAAKKLGLSPPTVTRTVSALEDRLGAPLLVRTTRSVRLTDAGRHFLEDARRILGDIADAEQAAAGARVVARGALRVTAPVLFGEMFMLPLLRQFLSSHPQLTAELLMLDRVVNIVEEGIDIALRIGRFEDSGLQSIELGSVRRMLVASPGYLAAHGTPRQLADLRLHRLTMSAGNSASHEWGFGTGATATSVHVEPMLTVSTLRAAIDSARDGWSITRVLSYQVRDDLQAGRLAGVLEDQEPPPLPVCLVFPQSRRPSARLMAFIDLASERLSAALAD
ncbi:MAG: LysR family transcriptional regulator [Arenimonas sp.]|nr:LysR family transcriptional regulator [Arenimonas sp.]